MKRAGFFTPAPKRAKFLPKAQTCPSTVPKDSVSVYCRIKPIDNGNDEESFAVPVSTRSLKLVPPVNSFAFRNGSAKEQSFKFQWVFPKDATQGEVFELVAKPLIMDLLNGRNALLFVYGITGSGKTYTMEGTRRDSGILRRTIHTIFNSISEYQAAKYIFKPDRMNGFEVQSEADAMLDRQKYDLTNFSRRTRRQVARDAHAVQVSGSSSANSSCITCLDQDNGYAVFVSYIEIYNNYVYDLLEEFSENNMTKDLQSKILREDAKHNMYVHGCTEVEVKSPEEAFEVLVKGQKRRKVAHTKLNVESSRSHSVFTVRVVQAPHDEKGEELLSHRSAITVSQFSMVDLAGSERNNRTKATGDRIKEAGNINNSLMVLRQCIEILRDNQLNQSSMMMKKVPYRESKLTHYFKNYFEGEGKVRMIVCVNPNPDDYDETLPVMKFAELASEVEVHLPIVTAKPDLGLVPGRRRVHQVFIENRRKLEEEFRAREMEAAETVPVYTLGPSWSAPKLTSSKDFERALPDLITFLRKRKSLKEKFKEGLRDQKLALHQRISEMEKENVLLHQENSSLLSRNDDLIERLKCIESKLLSAEASNDSLHKKFSDYDCLLDEYIQVCDERDQARMQGQIDKQKLKSRIKAKLKSEREKMAKDLSTKFDEQKSQLKIQMYEHQVKALQEMLDYPVPSASTSLVSGGRIKAAKSEENLVDGSKMPSDLVATPLVKHHRRSLTHPTTTELWIDHKPNMVVEPYTLLQPDMPCRKSVRRLRSGDLLDCKKTSRYCLTTQGQDSSGEMETQMYKGDILPTVGGGAQVVFNDVEILKQRDPLEMSSTGKRGNDGQPKVDMQTVQARCATGVGSSNNFYSRTYNKRLRK